MIDMRYPFKAKAYLGQFEIDALLPRHQEDFASEAEARYFLDLIGCGGTIEHFDGKNWRLIKSILPPGEGGIASVA